jgi:hypothetical protein
MPTGTSQINLQQTGLVLALALLVLAQAVMACIKHTNQGALAVALSVAPGQGLARLL